MVKFLQSFCSNLLLFGLTFVIIANLLNYFMHGIEHDLKEAELKYILSVGKPQCLASPYDKPKRPWVQTFQDHKVGTVAITYAYGYEISLFGKYYFVGGKGIPRKYDDLLDNYFATACKPLKPSK